MRSNFLYSTGRLRERSNTGQEHRHKNPSGYGCLTSLSPLSTPFAYGSPPHDSCTVAAVQWGYRKSVQRYVESWRGRAASRSEMARSSRNRGATRSEEEVLSSNKQMHFKLYRPIAPHQGLQHVSCTRPLRSAMGPLQFCREEDREIFSCKLKAGIDGGNELSWLGVRGREAHNNQRTGSVRG